MPSALSPEEQAELARLLVKVADEDKGFIPDPAYRPFHKMVPWPAVEVLIYDEFGRFVLAHRDDDFKGWHIPGGFIRVNESYQVACNRNIRKDKTAEAVTDLKLIASHTWLAGEHPFGYPLSLVVACKAVGPVTVSDTVQWFSEIPPDVIKEQHPKYLKYFQEWVQSSQRGFAQIIP